MFSNSFDFFEKIYCINLDSRTDRWKECQEEFSKVGILERVERISGIVFEGHGSKKQNACYGNHLTHAKILRKAQDLGLNNVLIFEDDVEFFSNAEKNLSLSINNLRKNHSNWDMLYLGCNLDRYQAFQVDENLIKLTGAFATHGYAINKSLFRKLIEINEDFTIAHNDVEYAYQIHPYYNCFLTWPLVAGQRVSYSDIMQQEMNSNPVFQERVLNNTKWLGK